MTYKRRASPLHAARAIAAIVWCGALAVSALIESNPVVLSAIAVSVVAAGLLAGVGSEVRRSLRWSVPLCLTICVINALVARNGLTVILAIPVTCRCSARPTSRSKPRSGARSSVCARLCSC